MRTFPELSTTAYVSHDFHSIFILCASGEPLYLRFKTRTLCRHGETPQTPSLLWLAKIFIPQFILKFLALKMVLTAIAKHHPEIKFDFSEKNICYVNKNVAELYPVHHFT